MVTKWPLLGHSVATTGSPNGHCMVTAQPSSPHCWGRSRSCCRALAQPFQPQLQFSIPCSWRAPKGSQQVPRGLLGLCGSPGRAAPVPTGHRRELHPHSCTPTSPHPALRGWRRWHMQMPAPRVPGDTDTRTGLPSTGRGLVDPQHQGSSPRVFPELWAASTGLIWDQGCAHGGDHALSPATCVTHQEQPWNTPQTLL